MKPKIVLIADKIPMPTKITLKNNDLECVEESYFNEVYESLQLISDGVTHYNNPEAMLNNISKHKNDIVLSIWSGKNSRNRKALVPSICESYGICYIGADPYVQMIAQDKHLSKYICNKHGIRIANDVLIEDKEQIKNISKLKFPLVVKPNFEGGSIGISSKNLVDTFADAERLINELLLIFKQPILVEEYIKGVEICVTLAGTTTRLDVLEADMIEIGGESYFEHGLFDYESKKENYEICKCVYATHLLDEKIKESFIKLFKSLGKVEVTRIDGRISDGKFILLELSPDMHLGKNWSTATAFASAGYSYTQMFERLIHNALETSGRSS
jgi:D-alanine-D-alanine ligase